tara:strand:+ start:146 stop:430 length:285 start_codon:yes stop_codon:yes gene_type:complete
MKFKYIESDEPMLTDDYYKLENNLDLDINIQVFKDNGTITYVVYEWFEKEGMMEEIDGFKDLSKAKKCARDYLFNKAFGKEFMKSNDKGNIKQY